MRGRRQSPRKLVEPSGDAAPRARREPPAVQVPDERPAPQAADALAIDSYLCDLFILPVTLEDCAAVRVALTTLGTGSKAEVYCHDGRTVHVVAWWDRYHCGPILRRIVSAR